MIDVHAHLAHPAFSDLPQVLERAWSSGVETIIVSITEPSEIVRAREVLAQDMKRLRLSVGFDPMILSEDKYEAFMGILASESVVGVGEVGIDHFYVRDHSQRAAQEAFFRRSIRFSMEKGLPLIVHSRSAGKLALEILYSEGAEHVLMHAFDGRASDALGGAERGYYFSIPPSVLYSDQKQKLVRQLPLESMMLETDSPVLAPVRGERNEPANIIFSAREIAKIKSLPLEDVAEMTSKNATALFRLQ
jgi:TatD DNase family protein